MVELVMQIKLFKISTKILKNDTFEGLASLFKIKIDPLVAKNNGITKYFLTDRY